MRKIRKRPFKNPTEVVLARIERDLWSWTALWGRADADRIVAAELDQMFERLGHECHIGNENPRDALERLRAEAEKAGNTAFAKLLTECLRVLGSACEERAQ